MRYAESYHVDWRRGTEPRGMLRNLLLSGGSRPSGKGGTAHPDPGIRGAPGLKNFFSALQASVCIGVKVPSPASATASYVIFYK